MHTSNFHSLYPRDPNMSYMGGLEVPILRNFKNVKEKADFDPEDIEKECEVNESLFNMSKN
jgi:hypothetical protein